MILAEQFCDAQQGAATHLLPLPWWTCAKEVGIRRQAFALAEEAGLLDQHLQVLRSQRRRPLRPVGEVFAALAVLGGYLK